MPETVYELCWNRYFIATRVQALHLLRRLGIDTDDGMIALAGGDGPADLSNLANRLRKTPAPTKRAPPPLGTEDEATARTLLEEELRVAAERGHPDLISLGRVHRAEDPNSLYLRLPTGRGGSQRIFSKAPFPGDSQLYRLVGGISRLLRTGKPLLIADIAIREVVARAAHVAIALHARRLDAHNTTLVAVLSTAAEIGDDQVFFATASIDAISNSRETDLPIWEPYDHLSHFLPLSWDRFATKQNEAAGFVWGVLNTLTPRAETIVDVGCGTGEILAYIYDRDPTLHCLGIDPSEQQIIQAKRGEKAGLSFVRSAIPSGQQSAPLVGSNNACVLFLGNTLAHIGARAFRDWLKNLEVLPSNLIFDFAANWREVIERSAEGVGVTASIQTETEQCKWSSQLITALGPRRVHRGIVVKWQRASPEGVSEVAEDQLFTRQFADPPETYFDALRTLGFSTASAGTYDSGWGEHDLYIARLENTGSAGLWPEPRNHVGFQLNSLWHDRLGKLWRRMFPALGFNHGQFLAEAVELFPAAILPFDTQRVWAKYICRESAEQSGSAAELFKAWMWLVAASDTSLPAEGAAKGEEVPPYAPGLHEAMLGDIPAAYIRQIVDRDLGLDLNESDRRLADLENNWWHSEQDQATAFGYYLIPLYFKGLPVFCVVAKLQLRKEWPPRLLSEMLRYEKLELDQLLAENWSWDDWEGFIRDAVDKLGSCRSLDDAVDGIHTERKWKSWLETLPGTHLLADRGRARSWSEFKAEHKRLSGRVRAAPYQQISSRLYEIRFFLPLKEDGLGHECFTRKHKEAVTTIKHWLAELKDASAVTEVALQLLNSLDEYGGSLPDDELALPHNDYQAADFRFQEFKSLFCRNGANTRELFRVSAIAVYAAKRIFAPDIHCSLCGDTSPKRFLDEKHARPKLAHGDSWGFLERLWVALKSIRPKSIDLSGKGDGLVVSVDLGKKVRLAVVGSSIASFGEVLTLSGVDQNSVPENFAGFDILLRNADDDHKALIATLSWHEGNARKAPGL